MALSVFDVFKVGVGPSSSHTVGPMIAAKRFVGYLWSAGQGQRVARVTIELFGSLGATGKGHATDRAVVLGLSGFEPATLEITQAQCVVEEAVASRRLLLNGDRLIDFDLDTDLAFLPEQALPFHSNGLQLRAWDQTARELASKTYYSVGGGFVVDGDEIGRAPTGEIASAPQGPQTLAFGSAQELVELAQQRNAGIASVMWARERQWQSDESIVAGLLGIWTSMRQCVARGCEAHGVLPGPLGIRRRAPELAAQLKARNPPTDDPLLVLDWVSLYAMAASEENAAGGRMVTAPTNGAAGVVPAVLHYYANFVPGASDKGVMDFLLTAGAIGILYKENASISGAEVGCQGEVGVACSMAAGALCQVLGGTPRQVENAAEIGMEHHLGLTCDPVGGLVQIPCIERNAVGAVKAISAARMALRGDGAHHVSLDAVIRTMLQTGADMKAQYKETSRGGLAVQVVAC